MNHQYPTKNALFICKSIPPCIYNSFCFSNHFLGRGRRQTMPSCGNPEKSAGLRLSLIFPTAAPTHAPFICHWQRSRVLPGTRVPRFKNFTHRQKIQAPQKRCLYFWQGQKDLAYAAALPCILMARRPKFCEFQYPPHRSSLKTVHRTVFLTLRPSRVQVLQSF